MKRDMEVVRKILLTVEGHEAPRGAMKLSPGDGDGVTAEQLAYHVKLLHDQGLLEATNFSTLGAFDWRPTTLTWAGHEFLDAIRNDTVWARAKKVIADKGGSMPFEMVREIVMVIARQYFTEPS